MDVDPRAIIESLNTAAKHATAALGADRIAKAQPGERFAPPPPEPQPQPEPDK